jgi:hypothetical protein
MQREMVKRKGRRTKVSKWRSRCEWQSGIARQRTSVRRQWCNEVQRANGKAGAVGARRVNETQVRWGANGKAGK